MLLRAWFRRPCLFWLLGRREKRTVAWCVYLSPQPTRMVDKSWLADIIRILSLSVGWLQLPLGGIHWFIGIPLASAMIPWDFVHVSSIQRWFLGAHEPLQKPDPKLEVFAWTVGELKGKMAQCRQVFQQISAAAVPLYQVIEAVTLFWFPFVGERTFF